MDDIQQLNKTVANLNDTITNLPRALGAPAQATVWTKVADGAMTVGLTAIGTAAGIGIVYGVKALFGKSATAPVPTP